MKLQHYSADFMETYNPTISTDLAYRATKEPMGDQYKIILSAACRNMFGCYPDPRKAVAAFNRYVGKYHVAKNKQPQAAISGATSTPPTPATIGKQTYSAEKFSVSQNCAPTVELLKEEQYGVELYSSHCASGTNLVISCQWGQCKLLK